MPETLMVHLPFDRLVRLHIPLDAHGKEPATAVATYLDMTWNLWSTTQRIAGPLALGMRLDELHRECIAEAFIAADLGV